MRRFVLASLVATLSAAAACKPDLGNPPSLVEGPRILAVRGTPAEAAEGMPVTYDLLAVDLTGRVSAPSTRWAVCDKRKAPAEANAVSAACLDIPDQGPPAPTFMALMPADACKRFGPQPDVDENKLPVRPRDPDVTGGFYQPVRAAWNDGGALAFAMERIKCHLANAPSDVTATFGNLALNQNPALTRVTLDPDFAPVHLFLLGQPPAAPVAVSAGSPFTFEVAWSDTTPETFPVWTAATESVETHRESLSVSWFATGGHFAHDRTGRGEADAEQPTRNVWTAPNSSGVVHVYVVLRDSRGGVDFTVVDVDVGAP